VAKPLISVVIATFNRCEILRAGLDRLAGQTASADDFEVLIVDDGSGDGTSKMVDSVISSMPYKLRYFRHENRGPGYTQNRGINKAEGDLVLLIADDVLVCPELVRQHLKTHCEYRDENIAVLGKVVQSPELPRTVLHRYWDPFRYDRFEGKSELDGINFLACNISVKKSFLLKSGMFKERRGAAHEDIELGYRLREKGLRIIYNELALGYHYHCETLTAACRRAYERGQNFDMLSENVPKSFVFPLYHICTLKAGLSGFVKLLPREIFRMILFNRLTVNGFWLPVLRRAETSRLAALFANRMTYRGTVHYHQRKGYRDYERQGQGRVPQGLAQAGR